MLVKYKYRLSAVLGVVAGIITGIVLKDYLLLSLRDYFHLMLIGIKEGVQNNSLLWQRVIRIRLKEFLFATMLILNPLHNALILCFLFIIGYNLGFYIISSVALFRLYGLIVAIGAIIPQIFIYSFAYNLIIKNFSIKNYILAMLLVLVGSYLEGMINPYILKYVFNQICIVI